MVGSCLLSVPCSLSILCPLRSLRFATMTTMHVFIYVFSMFHIFLLLLFNFMSFVATFFVRLRRHPRTSRTFSFRTGSFSIALILLILLIFIDVADCACFDTVTNETEWTAVITTPPHLQHTRWTRKNKNKKRQQELNVTTTRKNSFACIFSEAFSSNVTLYYNEDETSSF